MLRRDLLSAAAAATVLSGSNPLFAAARRPRARVRPSDPGWPTAESWAALGAATGGSLIEPKPMLAPCLVDAKSADCKALVKSLQNPFFISDQPSGTQISGYLDAWAPAVSRYCLAAKSAADVAAAVRFARVHDLRLVVKGGGHSYLGGSNAPDSLMIWTHPMRQITLHEAFVPAGGAGLVAPTPAVSIGAGCRWIEVYDAVTTKAGRYVQGGGCTSVGVAGLVQGGGFGSLSKAFGTGAAGLIEAEVVTADGQIRVVNAHRSPDLFWALKGGGGGSFGVVTRLTLLTHAAPKLGGGFEVNIKAADDEAFRKLIAAFVDLYAERLFNPAWGEQVLIGKNNTLKVGMVSMDLTERQMMDAWAPLLSAVESSKGPWRYVTPPDAGAAPFRTWWDAAGRRARGSKAMRYDDRPGAPATQAWWSGDSDQVSAFFYGYDSMWLPSSLLKPAERGRLVDALFAASRRYNVALHFNKGLGGAPADAVARSRDTATSPKVLDAFALAIIADGGPPAWYDVLGFKMPLEGPRRAAAAMREAMVELSKCAPGAGSYISESSYFRDDWREAFWGDHYPRLRAIKDKVDPSGLFFVHHGVGSEDWSADGFTRVA